ncbi:hypothetical protein ABT072_25835 [Streptomyces sp. NPDC002589]|uniref:hypothetical protein n=1 Tax=Streptomyces sp. NPDC002589 TaxID=3154420 RepID=UPI00332EC54C
MNTLPVVSWTTDPHISQKGLRQGIFVKETSQELAVDKAVCQPAGYAMNGLPVGSSQASLTRVAGKQQPDGILTNITLSAHG